MSSIPEKVASKTYTGSQMVWLFAALEKHKKSPNQAVYNDVSAMSGGTMTPSSVEHQFREVKKAASALLAANGGTADAGSSSVPATPRKRTKAGASTPKSGGVKQAKSKAVGNHDDDDEDEDEDEDSGAAKKNVKKARKTKQELPKMKVEDVEDDTAY